jgi:arsenite-transporting ATPase
VKKQQQIKILCGTGGVGKTTLSASYCIHQALKGKNTCVLTIDPARRLMQALGLANQENSINLSAFLGDNVKAHAFMLEREEFLFQILESFKIDKTTQNRMKSNPFFQTFSQRFSGINEIIALEKLLSVSQNPEWDCIILDTPPASNLTHFLNTPDDWLDFLNEPLLQKVLLPFQSFFTKGITKLMDFLTDLTHPTFITDLMQFSVDLFSLQKKLTAHLLEIKQLFSSSQVQFIGVICANRSSEEIHLLNAFLKKIQEKNLHIEGIIVNKSLKNLYPNDLEFVRFALEQEKNITDWTKQNHIPILATLPAFNRDIQNIKDLSDVAHFFS